MNKTPLPSGFNPNSKNTTQFTETHPQGHLNGQRCVHCTEHLSCTLPTSAYIKLNILDVPQFWHTIALIIMCSNIGTPKIINFPFGTLLVLPRVVPVGRMILREQTKTAGI